MSIRFNCSKCDKALRAPENLAGKVVRCPDCNTKTPVPKAKKQQKVAVGAADDPGFEIVEEATPSPDVKQGKKQPDGKKKAALRECPECEEMIPETAVICRFCKTRFDLATKEAKQRSDDLQKKKPKSNPLLAVVLLLVIAGAGGAAYFFLM